MTRSRRRIVRSCCLLLLPGTLVLQGVVRTALMASNVVPGTIAGEVRVDPSLLPVFEELRCLLPPGHAQGRGDGASMPPRSSLPHNACPGDARPGPDLRTSPLASHGSQPASVGPLPPLATSTTPEPTTPALTLTEWPPPPAQAEVVFGVYDVITAPRDSGEVDAPTGSEDAQPAPLMLGTAAEGSVPAG